MADKSGQLKKKLLRDAIIGVVILLALAGGGYELSDYDDQTQTDKQQADGENSTLRSKNAAVQTFINNGSEVNAFFADYIETHNKSFTLTREILTGILPALREKHHLTSLSVTIPPITDVSGNTLSLKTGKMVQSDVKFTFKALTDVSIYNFIEDLQHVLPGIILLHEVKIKRTGEITATMLRDLSAHKLDPLVDVELSFLWLGIRVEKTDDNAAHTPMGFGGRPPR